MPLEAMRRPLIVVTDVGGTRELINNNKNGFFNPGGLHCKIIFELCFLMKLKK